MISEDGERKALNVVAKVLYCEEDGQKLTIESAVLPLSIGKLPGEECHWAPDTIEKLLKLTTNCPVRSIHRDGGGWQSPEQTWRQGKLTDTQRSTRLPAP